jgi:ABC-type glutathione transport system ATPase component
LPTNVFGDALRDALPEVENTMTGPSLHEVETSRRIQDRRRRCRSVDGVSFSIQAGETFALVASRSGKS